MRVLGLLCCLAVAVAGAAAAAAGGAWVDEDDVRQFEVLKERVRHQLQQLEEKAAKQTVDPRLMEDATLTTPELIAKYGYPAETHEIVTEDGYVLTFHRIPHGRSGNASAPNTRPLYLSHGLMSSSDDWIITGPQRALGYILADAGYDVWIGNSRGKKWSRKHVTLNPKKSKFWDFSWHEMGAYDLPAAIDYILAATGAERLHYVGHSMGTTMFTVMATERPEYNAKVKVAALLAPAVFFRHQDDPFLKLVVRFVHQLDLLSRALGVNELMVHSPLLTVLGDRLCQDGDPKQVLYLAASYLIGVNLEQLNTTLLPVLLAHFPSGAATKDFLHYGQSIRTGDFRQYDRGTVQNLIKYGSVKPPKYNLSNFSTPVVIHYTENDSLAPPRDAEYFAEILPNLVSLNKVDNEKFNHLDFVIANQAKELVYDKLISQLDKY